MTKYLIGAVIGAIAAAAGVSWAASTVSTTGPWVGVPPLAQELLNARFAEVVADIEALQAGTTIAAGSITGAQHDGPEAYGTAEITCATDGNFTIAHTLTGTPVLAILSVVEDTTVLFDVESIGATNIVGHCKAVADGADVTSGTFTMGWLARIAP